MKDTIYLRFDRINRLEELRKGNFTMKCPIAWNDFHSESINDAINDNMESIGDKTIGKISGVDKINFVIDTGSGNKMLGKALEPDANITVKWFYKNAHKDRAYCLYRLEIENGIIVSKVDPRNKKFGYDSFVIIKSIDDFVKRITTVYPNYDICHGNVHYSSADTGRKAFDKPLKYSYQNETRILITDGSISDYNDGHLPYDLKVGNMEDITSDIYDFNSIFIAQSINDFIVKR